MKKRVEEIDFLRGVGMVGMILIHTTYYFISDPMAYVIWNYSQFAVPLFIFCSAYLSYQSNKSTSFEYLMKRFVRLLKPYWIFLLFFIPLQFFTNSKILTTNYIIHSALATGGVDISWLVLLFIEFSILAPVLMILRQKSRIVYFLYFIFAFGVSIVFCFYQPNFNYRYIMLLPWSLLFFVAEVFVKKKQAQLITIIASLVTYLVLLFIFLQNQHPTSFIQNKYPPNLYILSYGVFSLGALYYVSQFVYKGLVKKWLSYISLHSYSIFFIHYFVLIFVITFLPYKTISWVGLFGLVFGVSMLIQAGIDRIMGKKV